MQADFLWKSVRELADGRSNIEKCVRELGDGWSSAGKCVREVT